MPGKLESGMPGNAREAREWRGKTKILIKVAYMKKKENNSTLCFD